MPTNDRSEIARRMDALGESAGYRDAAEMADGTGQPWTCDVRWVVFACGCRAERARSLNGPQPADPIIFRGLPQQAVYDSVCDTHRPKMDYYLGTGYHRMTFADWHRLRRPALMRKA